MPFRKNWKRLHVSILPFSHHRVRYLLGYQCADAVADVEDAAPVHVQDGVEADPGDVEEVLGRLARPELVAEPQHLLPVPAAAGARQPAQPRAREVDEVATHDPVALAADVEADELVAAAQTVVLLLLQ